MASRTLKQGPKTVKTQKTPAPAPESDFAAAQHRHAGDMEEAWGKIALSLATAAKAAELAAAHYTDVCNGKPGRDTHELQVAECAALHLAREAAALVPNNAGLAGRIEWLSYHAAKVVLGSGR